MNPEVGFIANIMYTKPLQSLIAGLVGTSVMTFIMAIAPEMGIPKANQPVMLSGMLDVSASLGWLAHFLIGIIFAALYVYLFLPIYAYFFQPIKTMEGKILKGAVFGLLIFILAQFMLVIVTSIYVLIAAPTEPTTLLIIRSLMGHLIFGVYAALSVKDPIVIHDSSYSKKYKT